MTDKAFTVLNRYNPKEIVGTVRIDDKSERLLSTGKYVIAPSWIEADKGGKLISFGLIHEDSFIKEPNRTAITLQLTTGIGLKADTEFVDMIWDLAIPQIGGNILKNDIEYEITGIIYDLDENKTTIIAYEC